MQELKDPRLLDRILAQKKEYFTQLPPVVRLLQFEKGELLTQPLKPLNQFLLILLGSVTIYGIYEDSRIYRISLTDSGVLLGDVEFCNSKSDSFFTEALEPVLCLSIPFRENRTQLENDPVFLRFVMRQLAGKLTLSTQMELPFRSLEEKLLIYLRSPQSGHRIESVNDATMRLRCSRRQLQRVLKKLCDQKILRKDGRGRYQLIHRNANDESDD